MSCRKCSNGITFIEAIKVNFNNNLSYIIFSLLIISAISTLDSTLSSAAKLVVIDLEFLPQTIFHGRVVMFIFTILGLAFIFLILKIHSLLWQLVEQRLLF